MAELQPPEGMMNGVMIVGGVSSDNPGTSLGSKRQRRPSVRLGDIGDQPATLSYESYLKRSKQQQWSHHHHHPPDSNKYRHPSQKDITSGKASKTRPLTNLSNGGGGDGDSHETLEPTAEDNKNNHHHHPSGGGEGDANLDLGTDNTTVVGGIGIGIGIVNNRRGGKDLKNKRGGVFGGGGRTTKRVRSNWVTKVNEGVNEAGDQEKFISGGEEGDEWYNNGDFDEAASESPLKEQSPANSLENTAMDLRQASDRVHGNERDGGLFLGQRRPVRTRVSECRDHGAVELDGPSDTDAREWRSRTSVDRNGVSERGRCSSLEDGVQSWLNGLGLCRYAPVFEIHEVDEEVLPLLTLEDLRDMGINAVGSRRKMYCAIQKLAKGFS